MPISLDPAELEQLVRGARAVFEALGGRKEILEEEQPTIDFAYSCVVTIAEIAAGEVLGRSNTWVKRPGTGEIPAADFPRVIGRRARRRLARDTQLSWDDIMESGADDE